MGAGRDREDSGRAHRGRADDVHATLDIRPRQAGRASSWSSSTIVLKTATLGQPGRRLNSLLDMTGVIPACADSPHPEDAARAQGPLLLEWHALRSRPRRMAMRRERVVTATM